MKTNEELQKRVLRKRPILLWGTVILFIGLTAFVKARAKNNPEPYIINYRQYFIMPAPADSTRC